MEEARDMLEAIIAYMERLAKLSGRSCRTLPYSALPSSVSAELTKVETLFENCLSSLENSPSLSDTRGLAFKLLKVQHLAATIRASTLFYRDELAYDAFTVQFKEIIDIAQSIITIVTGNGQVLGFAFDLGIVQPLWFTACKCRHPVLRRKAIFLLKRSGIEGLWDGSAIAAVATWAMGYEERGGVGEGDELFVPEERRLRGIGIVMDRMNRKVRPASVIRVGDGSLEYVGATVRWGEEIVVLSEYPNKGLQDDGLSFWIPVFPDIERRAGP